MDRDPASAPAPSPVASRVPGNAAGEVSQRRTRRGVARTLLALGATTAADLAARLDLTPAGVRRHLDALIADGLVEAREQLPRGPRGRGRPAKVFALTALGRDEFHQAYDVLATDALTFLRETAGDAAVADFARRRLADLGDRLRPAVEQAAPEQRLAALAEALTEQGYAATARTTDAGSPQLCQHHCPVAHAAVAFPELCAAETELISELLGTHVQRLATLAHGDGVCTTHVPAATRHVPAQPRHLPAPARHLPAPQTPRISGVPPSTTARTAATDPTSGRTPA